MGDDQVASGSTGSGGSAGSAGSTGCHETVADLKKQLREKDMALTDIRLEALSSAHQLEALRETVTRLRVTIPQFQIIQTSSSAIPESFENDNHDNAESLIITRFVLVTSRLN